MVATISMEPRKQDVDVVVVTLGRATTGEDSPFPQVRFAEKKKVQFDVNTDKDTFFEAHDEMRINSGKLLVYEMETAFDSNMIERPSR